MPDFFFSTSDDVAKCYGQRYIFLSLYDLWLGKQKTIQSTQNRFVYKNTHSKAFEKKNIWILWKYLLSVPLEFR